MRETLYEIPPDCICMGDGLMGMRCPALRHATLKIEHRLIDACAEAGAGTTTASTPCQREAGGHPDAGRTASIARVDCVESDESGAGLRAPGE